MCRTIYESPNLVMYSWGIKVSMIIISNSPNNN